MITSLVAFLAIGLNAPAIDFTLSVKDGDRLTGDAKFTVRVESSVPVTQVEFYVGDDLRSTDSSTPYEFDLDTLNETDGNLKLTFGAYNSSGESKKKSVTVAVDNGVSKGADHHVGVANEALALSKWDDAILACRIALKAKPKHIPAMMAMSRAYLGKRVYDQAQKYAEDVMSAEPKNADAQQLLSAIFLQQSFSTFDRGSKEDTLKSIRESIKKAVANRRQFLDELVDNFGAVNDANRFAYCDLAFKAQRYSLVTNQLANLFKTDTRNSGIANRLAYAYVQQGRWDDAFSVLNENKRQGMTDAYGYALLGLIKQWQSKEAESDENMKEAVLSDSENMGVLMAQAAISLRRLRFDTVGRLANNFVRDQGFMWESHQYMSIAQYRQNQFVDSMKSFQKAVLSEPTAYSAFVERGNQALEQVLSTRIDASLREYQGRLAKAYYEAALAARPDSAEALTGLAMMEMIDRKALDAVRLARAAIAANPNYAAGLFGLSAFCSQAESDLRAAAAKIRAGSRDGSLSADQRQQIDRLLSEANNYGKEATTANNRAGAADVGNLRGRNLPNFTEAFTYFIRYGRLPVMVPPKG